MPRQRTRKAPHGRKQDAKEGFVLFALFFTAFVLLILSRLENEAVRGLRSYVADWATPVLEGASLPAVYARRGWERAGMYVTMHQELERLRAENDRLKQWRWQAQHLERRMVHLRALLNAVDEQALDQVTARVIADARGPFVRTTLVNAGQREGVKAGYAVINGDGLVGRTVHVGENASRVILLNDLNSRIPVLVGPSAIRAVLVGDNTSEPRLEFVPEGSELYEGDEIYTSGHAGLLPRGIRVGLVASGDREGHRVNPHAKLSDLEFVSVLFFDSPLVVATEKPAGATPRDGRPDKEQDPLSVMRKKDRRADVGARERPQKRAR